MRIFSTKISFSRLPSPTPAKECRVPPPMLTPAIPVDAVMAISSDGSGSKSLMISRRRTDFPTPDIVLHELTWVAAIRERHMPAGPVKKIDFPFWTSARTAFCSSERMMFAVAGTCWPG
ncbi:hypothetical protein BDV98DRAFT_504426 [Pterulicium gracile]|uniref:Uncharacterized protein n=1 Tax=Pterulicium gracile TaxID=1884261 RepID=A0A5C3QNS7_9AGAR|nr:hypothetical protein BDV98DRAFT_504426 [Pterula gracilis]